MAEQTEMTGFYKVLVDGKGTYSGKLWSLPTADAPGEWMEVTGALEMCHNGLHVTDWQGIWQHWIVQNATIYRAEIEGETIGSITDSDRKIAARQARLLSIVSDVELPDWWRETQEFIATLETIPWMQPDGKPAASWLLFPNRASARDSAGASAWASAWDSAWVSAWASARDSELMASILICGGTDLDRKHIEHAAARMNVWRKGYGLLGDINGALYVYESLV